MNQPCNIDTLVLALSRLWARTGRPVAPRLSGEFTRARGLWADVFHKLSRLFGGRFVCMRKHADNGHLAELTKPPATGMQRAQCHRLHPPFARLRTPPKHF